MIKIYLCLIQISVTGKKQSSSYSLRALFCTQKSATDGLNLIAVLLTTKYLIVYMYI